MKKSKRILAGLLSVLVTSTMIPMTAISASAVSETSDPEEPEETELFIANGSLDMTKEMAENVETIATIGEYYEFLNENIPGANYSPPNAGSLPSKVDNSTNSNAKYFAPVYSQGSLGSCVLWATTYHQFTYTINKARGVATNTSNTYSPNFLHNFLNSGNGRNGTVSCDAFDLLSSIGAPTTQDVPLFNDRDLYDKVRSWYATGDIWEHSSKNRITSYAYFTPSGKTIGYDGYGYKPVSGNTPVTSAKSTQLDAMKAALNNGAVFAFSSDISEWKDTKIKSCNSGSRTVNPNGYTVDNSFVNEYVIYCCDGYPSGHHMAIVGYNDEIWTDINGNNVVDAGEMGAFKILNSWGASGGWGIQDRYGKYHALGHNKQFVWMAYDALNKVSAVSGAPSFSYRDCALNNVSTITVSGKSNDSSNIFLRYTLNSINRSDVKIKVTAKDKSGSVVKQMNSVPYNVISSCGNYSFNGATTASDGTMAFDLNNLVPNINSTTLNNYTWSVEVSDTKADGNKLTVKEIKIVDRNANKEYKMNATAGFQLDGTNKTVEIPIGSDPVPANSTTIYYKGYSNPNIHYRAGTGAWTAVPGVKMTATSEMPGYTHKYTISLGTATYAEVCFNDGNNNWDSRNGANYKFNSGTYTFSNGTITKVEDKELSGSVSLSASKAPLNQNVTVTANATGGKAPYQYQFSINGCGTNTVLKAFSTSNNATFKVSTQGTYTVDVRIKDAAGDIVTKSASFQGSIVTISGLRFSKTGAKEGETVNVAASVTGGAGIPLKYEYTVTGNGTTTTLTTKSDNTADWKPTKEGTYTVKARILFNGSEVHSTQLSYTVAKGDPVPVNSVTIYYKGYANPNIHYRAGTGSWTTPPGVKMTATSEMSGFTHKYTISLGTATYAEVCFNDGNGNWDSRNGANYKFNKGTWTFSNGTIKEVQNLALSASVSVTHRYLPLGQTISATATASGGTAPYQYRYTYLKNGVETNVLNYNGSRYAMYRVSELGDYTIKVYVKDSKGTVATATAPYTAVKYEVSSLTANKAKIKAGETVTFTAAVTNSNVSATYQFTATGNGTTQTFSNSSSLTANWTPSKEGTYVISVAGYYEGAPIATKSMSYTVEKGTVVTAKRITIYYKGYSNPNIHYQVGSGAWTAVPGRKMTATSEMNGFTHKYTIDLGTATYANVCFNDGNNNWDSRNGANYRFEKGTWTYTGGSMRKISDSESDGNATTIVSTGLMNLSSLSAEKAAPGTAVTVNCDAAGGSGTYKYAVYYKKSSDSKWATAQDYKENSEVTIKPAKAVPYDVCVKVKDGNKEISKIYLDLEVTSELTNTTKLAQTTITKGDTVSVNCSAIGGKSGYTYAVYYKKTSDTNWAKAQDFEANAKVSIKPSKAVAYDVCVKVKDASGKTVKDYYTVEVNEKVENTTAITSNEIAKGEKVTVCCSANGYTAPYVYQVLYKKSADSSWAVAQAYDSNDTVSIRLKTAVNYDICVKAKDSEGTVAKKYFTVAVTE